LGYHLAYLYEKAATPSYWTAVFISTLMLSIIGISAPAFFAKESESVR
jgi:hypothetical protein